MHGEISYSQMYCNSNERSLTNIDYTMISKFPAGLQPEDAKGATLSGVEISKGGVGYMVSL